MPAMSDVNQITRVSPLAADTDRIGANGDTVFGDGSRYKTNSRQ